VFLLEFGSKFTPLAKEFLPSLPFVQWKTETY